MRRFFSVFCFLAIVLPLLAASCLGAGAGISFRRDGSGTITLEYRISRLAESLGRLDGNEGWPIVPLGRADFERTVKRLDGLSLRSYRARDEGEDRVIRAGLDFANPRALAAFLSPGRASYAEEGGRRRLSLDLGAGAGISAELRELFSRVSAGYFLELNFSLPAEGELSLLDGQGAPRSLPAGAELKGRGKQLSFKAPMAVLAAETGGLRAVLSW
jgi:hypothetical protein